MSEIVRYGVAEKVPFRNSGKEQLSVLLNDLYPTVLCRSNRPLLQHPLFGSVSPFAEGRFFELRSGPRNRSS
jgi:hypothetical protein